MLYAPLHTLIWETTDGSAWFTFDSVFAANGHLGSAAGVTDGFKPAVAVCALLSLLGALTALAVTGRASLRQVETAAANVAA